MFAVVVGAIMMQAVTPAAATPAPESGLSDASFIYSPNWDRHPSAGDIARAYPEAASKVFLAGVAKMTCVVTAEGRLTECAVAAENPADAGFGVAAQSLMPLFRIKSIDKDGHAVAGRRVMVPIRFSPTTDVRSAPLKAPPTAKAAGQVELDCRYQDRRLDNCLAIGGNPGVEAEARRLAAEMTLPEMPRPTGRIALPFYFLTDVPAQAQEDGSRVAAPDWRRRPTGADMARVYPRRALSKGISGMALTACQVTREGTLADCVTVDENPMWEGFGEAALKLMPLFVMRPMTKNGQPVDGGTVRIPIHFRAHR